MNDFSHDSDHPLDGQYDNAEMAAAEIVASAKKVGLSDVELPIVDQDAVWSIKAKRLGIENPTESKMQLANPDETPDALSD